jgi:hypothetical protein
LQQCRLDTVHRGSALVSDYGFDDNGNRTTHRIGPASPLRGQSWPCLGALPAVGDATVSGSYDAQDRMTAYGSCSYDYTRNGELTRRVDSATNSTTRKLSRQADNAFLEPSAAWAFRSAGVIPPSASWGRSSL